MSNQLTSNPMRMEAAGTVWSKTNKWVRLIQWVDDDGDITHPSVLTIVVNGVSLTTSIQPLAAELGFGAVAWEMGPFNPGVPISDLVVSAMDQGHLHIWLE